MCFGGGGTTVVNTPSESKSSVPQWVQDKGKELFDQAIPMAERDYPFYDPTLRTAPFSADTQQAHDIARSTVGSYAPAADNAYNLTATGASGPITQSELDAYQNPYMKDVISTTMTQMDDQFSRDRNSRNAAMAGRGSYLNEDRREMLDVYENAQNNKAKAEVEAMLRSGMFDKALGAAQQDRARAFQGGSQFAELAPLIQRLGITDAATMSGVGGEYDQKVQELLDNAYDEFNKQFYYPQEQLNYLLGLLNGVPVERTTTSNNPQLVTKSNPFGQVLGAGMSLASKVA